ncbi:L,D-transpeptidase family protein [Flavihumibacter sp.]|uniref:L,D-transpeptidase family protein n=1 Tax=Flavihumibacter sp. TaxID=1913981 RepID=UPI002FC96FC5
MRKIFILITLATISLLSCKSQEEKEAEKAEKEKKKISKRNTWINKSNSYSDLFLDSMNVEKFIADRQVPDSISNRMRSFYNARNYQFGWFNSKGFTEQAYGFWNLYDHYVTYSADSSLLDKPFQKKMNALMEDEFSVGNNGSSVRETELMMTVNFLRYSLANFADGYVKRKELERFVPFTKRDPMEWADSLLNKKHKDNKYFEDINPEYAKLKEQLNKYFQIAQNGGWPLPGSAKLPIKKGQSTDAVLAIKKHLQLTGDLPGNDTTKVFDDAMENGIKSYQERYGYTPTGIVNADLLKHLNVPATERVKQLLLNLDRMRWMPSQPKGKLIVINIPEYKLHALEDGKEVFDMEVVVGKVGHHTSMFTGTLNQVVFSPHWNVPPSIVKDEILPAMEKNPNYLAENNMEIVETTGELPTIRQLPGEKNALGKVKFLFPNSFNIYLHDTPSKSLFSRDKRAFSHGCIRVSEPSKLASYLLEDEGSWDDDRIFEAMNAGTEKFVKLKDPAEVFITYYTAWVDERGRLNFREDIYGMDKEVAGRMFTKI